MEEVIKLVYLGLVLYEAKHGERGVGESSEGHEADRCLRIKICFSSTYVTSK